MSYYYELPLIGGPKDGHIVRLQIRKDNTIMPRPKVYKVSQSFDDRVNYALYEFSEEDESYHYVARCDSQGAIPAYIEISEGVFTTNAERFK